MALPLLGAIAVVGVEADLAGVEVLAGFCVLGGLATRLAALFPARAFVASRRLGIV